VPRALGIDVGVRKGLDLVLLDERGRVEDMVRHAGTDDVTRSLAAFEPDLVAIDSPPAWGVRGGLRLAERELLRFGIHSYGTPSDRTRQASAFYDWMREGFRVFETAASNGYPLYRGGSPRHTAMEVFPHASAVALARSLPPSRLARTARAAWRADVLVRNGVDTEPLQGPDQIDAALAALTGLLALDGRCTAFGDPAEGVIVIPLDGPPKGAFPREVSDDGHAASRTLPGFHKCECGCGRPAARRFLPGHDAKLKSRLLRDLRAGDRARSELERLGWLRTAHEEITR
jgi:predicted nuclease with RNAse H fold